MTKTKITRCLSYTSSRNCIKVLKCNLQGDWCHDRILGGVLTDGLRSELPKIQDLTRQATHNYCRTSRSTSLSHKKLFVPNVHFTLLENSRLKKGQLLASCKCCGNKCPFTQSSRCPAFPWKKCNKCKKVCKDLSAEGSQAAAVELETRFNHDVHTCFGSVELDSVSGTRKKNLELN